MIYTQETVEIQEEGIPRAFMKRWRAIRNKVNLSDLVGDSKLTVGLYNMRYYFM